MRVRFLLWGLLGLIVLSALGLFLLFSLSDRDYHLGAETLARVKAPITPDQKAKLLSLAHPLLGPPPEAPKARAVIVGMDGLDFRYLEQLLRQGKLPHFKRIIDEGVSATLHSILPPNSGGAWPSLVTGCNPGKTGLLNFRHFNFEKHKIVLTDARDLRRPALWDILGAYGKKSVVINEPMSYPPHKIKGILVSGLLASEEGVYTHPEALTPLLKEIGYRREPVPEGEWLFSRNSTRLDDHLFIERKRLALARLFLEETDWDLFFCMFSNPDRMMHHIGDPFSPEDLETVLLELDGILGVFLEHLPRGATLFVVSDHGFDFYPRQFSVPRFLEREGYWVLPQGKPGTKSPWMRFLQSLKELKENTPLPDIPSIRWPRALKRDPLLPPIDWERTKAVGVEVGGDWGSIRILKEGKEKKALREEIAAELSRLVHLDTKERLVTQVLYGEEIYQGPYQGMLPDLVFQLKGTRADFAFHTEVLRKDPTYHHRQEGVFFAWGEGIRRNPAFTAAEIVDVAPTVLYLLELPVSENLDGKILKSLFSPDVLSVKPVNQISDFPPIPVEWVETPTPPGEVPEDVQETLRSLGYLQ